MGRPGGKHNTGKRVKYRLIQSLVPDGPYMICGSFFSVKGVVYSLRGGVTGTGFCCAPKAGFSANYRIDTLDDNDVTRDVLSRFVHDPTQKKRIVSWAAEMILCLDSGSCRGEH